MACAPPSTFMVSARILPFPEALSGPSWRQTSSNTCLEPFASCVASKSSHGSGEFQEGRSRSAASMKEFTTQSAEETTALGRKLAAELKPGAIVLLCGDLGAGKTTLVKGIAEGFQAAEADRVTSPTFTLIHEYRGPQVTLYHIDLYRIDTPRELDTLALDDLIDANSILLIEWGEKFERFRRERDVEIAIEHRGGDDRSIKIGR